LPELPPPAAGHAQKPSDPPGETYCPNCGGVVPWRRPAAARPTTVLWIDDDRLVLGACAPLLERRGHRVLIATDGAAGRGGGTSLGHMGPILAVDDRRPRGLARAPLIRRQVCAAPPGGPRPAGPASGSGGGHHAGSPR